MVINFRSRSFSLGFYVIGFLAMVLSGCSAQMPDRPAEENCYHQGTMYAENVLAQGPLEVKIWRIVYTSSQMQSTDGGTHLRIPNMAVYLKFHNLGELSLLVERVSPMDSDTVSFYLVDQSGNRYPAKSRGWSMNAEALDAAGGYVLIPSDNPRIPSQHLLPNDGVVQPQETIESVLEFGGIPCVVTELMLVMEGISTEEGENLRVETEVLLPSPFVDE